MTKSENNIRFDKLISEKDLKITHLVRYVYILENEKKEFLFIRRIEAAVGSLYLGWQLMAETYWGSDWDDDDILNLARKALTQFTQLTIRKEDIVLSDLFISNQQEQDILHIVYYIRVDDTSSFEYWYEYDDEVQWCDKDKAMSILAFKEDKDILNRLHENMDNLLS